MILHIPHASTLIPNDVREGIVLSVSELERELLLMTDAHTDDLFSPPGDSFVRIIFPVSRLVVDPERFLDDQQEPMSTKGMGVIYTHASDGKRLRPDLTPTERVGLIEKYYLPHHARLEAAVADELECRKTALIVDCHSFPSKPLPYEFEQTTDRPDICIGADDYHTPRHLLDTLAEGFQRQGYSVAINHPFAGSIVPLSYCREDRRVVSVMIELNRRLYMDEETGEKTPAYLLMKSTATNILQELEWLIQQ